jgi:hypothetical protein
VARSGSVLVVGVVSNLDPAIIFIDFSDLANPVLVNFFHIQNFTFLANFDISCDGRFVYALGDTLRKYDMEDPANLTLLFEVPIQQTLGLK